MLKAGWINWALFQCCSFRILPPRTVFALGPPNRRCGSVLLCISIMVIIPQMSHFTISPMSTFSQINLFWDEFFEKCKFQLGLLISWKEKMHFYGGQLTGKCHWRLSPHPFLITIILPHSRCHFLAPPICAATIFVVVLVVLCCISVTLQYTTTILLLLPICCFPKVAEKTLQKLTCATGRC